jgi:hypothetical protein
MSFHVCFAEALSAFSISITLRKLFYPTNGICPKIRVHLQDRHTPIYGDDVYGLPDWNKRLSQTHQIDRPLLHAYKLTVEHPITGELMEFTAPLDSDMKCIAQTIVPKGSEQGLSELLTWE